MFAEKPCGEKHRDGNGENNGQPADDPVKDFDGHIVGAEKLIEVYTVGTQHQHGGE